MSERENIKNRDGNWESLRRYENSVASGEEAYEKELEAIIEIVEEFVDDINDVMIANPDFRDEILEYVKDRLWHIESQS